MEVKRIIFDLDGTLINWQPEYLMTFQKVIAEFKLAVLTNWFRCSQYEILKTAGIAQYFQDIVGGDEYIKPNPNSYLLAIGNNKINECVMVGDSYEIDIKGALDIGMARILINKDDRMYDVSTIKNVYELPRILKKEK